MKSKLTYRCRKCGSILTSWAAAERCADAHVGARIDLIGLNDACDAWALS